MADPEAILAAALAALDARGNSDHAPPHDDRDAPEGAEPLLELDVVTFAAFAAELEVGAEPVVGTPDDVVIPVGGDVMVYGDGGAGKTTMSIDLACHLGAGRNWLGLTIPAPCTVTLVENEGPRPPFRAKLRRKLTALATWTDPPLDPERLRIVQNPWARLNLANENHRIALAAHIAASDTAVVIIGPLATSGMLGAGTAQEARDFLRLCNDVRRRSGRNITFIVIHHENKGGKVSGAWEGAGDTLLHVTGKGPGRTRLYFQKVRWSSTWHAKALDLAWADGDGFTVEDKPERTDDDLADSIIAVIASDPGTGWTKVEKAVLGVAAERRRSIRDQLLEAGRIVNVIMKRGDAIALTSTCEERKPCHLHVATDPTISHLRPEPDADGTQMELL